MMLPLAQSTADARSVSSCDAPSLQFWQEGAAPQQQVQDPYANEPKRHPALVVRTDRPFNAEPPMEVLAATPITPNEFFYVRNHLPVPHIDPATYKVVLIGVLWSLIPDRCET